MSKYLIEEGTLQNLADATRAVSETEENMSTEEMVATLLATAQILPNVVRATEQTLTDEQKQKARENIGAAAVEELPSYWKEHLEEKMATIKKLHREYGKECFSFVFMTDIHYPANLGKRSPLIAKKIADECSIKYVICGGDAQTRGCHTSKEELLAENVLIDEFFKPISDRLLRVEGNHDGCWGKLDKDGSGALENAGKPIEDYETYVYNLTPQELHEHIYRKVGAVGNVHFDETGTAYYIDDTSNNVRYIGLNTQCNKYELKDDGTVKYPKMWLFRFTQPQFNFLINEALVEGMKDSTKVIVFAHCPLNVSIGDREVMQGVLNAFKNKTAYSGIYEGTAEGESGIAYTNLADPTSSEWQDGYRISSSGISAQTGKTVINHIPCQNGDVIRIKGITFVDNADRIMCYTAEGERVGGISYINVLPNDYLSAANLTDEGIYEITVTNASVGYVQFAFTTPENPSQVIVTVNEEIKESSGVGYDYVSVNCDFTAAKGELVGYFSGHNHEDFVDNSLGFNLIGTRCDSRQENDDTLKAERVEGTITEQSFDVFTVTPDKIYATKIGAGNDREIPY